MNKYVAVGILMFCCALTIALALTGDVLMSEMQYIPGTAMIILCCSFVGIDAALATYVGERFKVEENNDDDLPVDSFYVFDHCPYCGRDVKQGDEYCRCGRKLSWKDLKLK